MRQSLDGNVFTGDSDGKYQNHTIQCNDNQDCTIVCEDANSCKHANIQCPITGKCNIECNSGRSMNVCQDITVSCPNNGDCTMKCTDDTACKDANIDGKTSALSLLCNGDNACTNTFINAKDTTHLTVQCAPYAQDTCASLTIYFPPNVNDEKMGIVSAGDTLSATNDHPLQFYAINGWNDVDITDYTGNWQNHIGIMHCGCDYTTECSFKSNDWQCMNVNDICNNPTLSLLIDAPLASIHSIKSTQTEIATVSSLYIHSPEVLLYVVIATVGLCLCFLGLACLYYVRYSRQHMDKLRLNSLSASRSMSLRHSMMLSIAKLSSSSLNSNTASAKSSSKDINIGIATIATSSQSKLKALISQSSESNVTNTTLSPEIRSNEEEHSNTDNPLCLDAQYSVNTPAAIAVEPTARPVVPNVSIQPTLSSGNNGEEEISYQQPTQHQMLQIMSVVNESQPPSLSSFVRNNQNGAYIMNQQPIPPSAQSSTESVTITAINDEKHNEIEFISSDDSDGKEERAMVDIFDLEHRIQTAKNYLVNNTMT